MDANQELGQELRAEESKLFFLGIDPGASGAWALLSPKGELVASRLTSEGLDFLIDCLAGWNAPTHRFFAVLEAVHAMPRQGVSSTFSFGENFGMWQGLLRGLKVPYALITPQKWQKILDIKPAPTPKAAGESEKDGAKRAAENKKRLKGAIVDFVLRTVPSAKGHIRLKKDWGKADAICLALYGLKNQL